MKICTLSPQGNGVRCGGITRFSGALKTKGIENYFWNIQSSSWNEGYDNWEGIPFKLDNIEDENDLVEKLQQYDIVVNNWPTLTTNEHNAYKMWNVWKRLTNPLKISIVHNTLLSAIKEENLSPLVWSDSDYILIQVSDNSRICTSLLDSMPWLQGKIKQFRQVLNADVFEERISNSLDANKKADLALWVGRWEKFRDSVRWDNVLQDANSLNYKSKYLNCAIGVDSDVKTYWSYFAPNKGKHVKTSKHLKSSLGPDKLPYLINDQDAYRFNDDYIHQTFGTSALNDFFVFGKYENRIGLDLLQSAKWGISTFGAWNDKVEIDYVSLAKLEYTSLEIMLLSLPIFDHRHLKNMEETELFDAPWVLKSKHNATPEENVNLIKSMDNIDSNEDLYKDYRLASIDYVKRKHGIHNFIDLLQDLYAQGKTTKLEEKEILKRLYGFEIDLTPDLCVTLKHTEKGIPHVIQSIDDKIKVIRRELPSKLF